MGAEPLGEIAHDAERLAIGVRHRGPQRVAELDGGGGLDEQRAGAGRLVVHDAFGPAAGVAAHRDDVAPVSHGDRCVRATGALPRSAARALELAHEPLAGGCTSRRAPARRGSRCPAARRPGRVTVQPPLDGFFRQRSGELGGERGRLGNPVQVGMHLAGRDDQPL